MNNRLGYQDLSFSSYQQIKEMILRSIVVEKINKKKAV